MTLDTLDRNLLCSCGVGYETDPSRGTIANGHKCLESANCPRCGAWYAQYKLYDRARGIYGPPGPYEYGGPNKTPQEMEEWDRVNLPVRKVMKTLGKIGSMFGSAYDLLLLVEEFGLFHGEASWDEDDYSHDYPQLEGFHYGDPDTPSCSAQQGWANPTFVCLNHEGFWQCSLGYGLHGVDLTFSPSGDLVGVLADSHPSQRCWGEGNRVQQVLDLLSTK